MELRGSAFSESGIESIRIPSTLKVIEAITFYQCKNLKTVEFSEGLERIEFGAFVQSGIRSIVLPTSTRAVCAQAFGWCKQLRTVRLNEGWKCWGRKRTSLGKRTLDALSKKAPWRALRFRPR